MSKNGKKSKKGIIILVIIVLVVVGVAAMGTGSDDKSDSAATKTSEEAKEPEMTTAQKNAYGSAQNYIDTMPFSRKGLIEQLSSEYGDSYDRKDAEFAVELLEKNEKVDWKEQAVKSAQNYLDTQSYSKQGLLEQLTSEYGEQFTQSEAEYAVEKVYK